MKVEKGGRAAHKGGIPGDQGRRAQIPQQPAQLLARIAEQEHRRDPLLCSYEFVPDKTTDRHEQRRGREQVIHDLHKPPLNKQNPISPRNPQRQKYLDAARKLDKGN